MTVIPYPSRMNDSDSIKFGTFSYLKPLDAKGIRDQVQYIVDQGWNPAIEHVEPDRVATTYWYMWKIPMFGNKDVDNILAEVEACKKANPGQVIKLIGYDNYAQSQGTALVVSRG